MSELHKKGLKKEGKLTLRECAILKAKVKYKNDKDKYENDVWQTFRNEYFCARLHGNCKVIQSSHASNHQNDYLMIFFRDKIVEKRKFYEFLMLFHLYKNGPELKNWV